MSPALKSPEVAHTAPLFVGILLAAAARALGCPFPIAYGLQVLITLALTLWLRRELLALYPPRFVRGMMAVGVTLAALWYAVERHVDYPHLGADNSALVVRLWLESEPGWRPVLWVLRVLGFIVLTPITEEIFFRGFMPRYLAGRDFVTRSFRATPWLCYFASAIAFASLHREWIPALVFALVMNELVKRTESLWACIVAHAVANLSLACWHLW